MVRLIIAVILLALPAHAQSIGPGYGGPVCGENDIVTIEDAGHGRAVVFYSNSVCSNSPGTNKVMTSPAGISVRVIITVNAGGNDKQERIEVIPLDPTMMAFPPDAGVMDGESTEIIVMGGVS